MTRLNSTMGMLLLGLAGLLSACGAGGSPEGSLQITLSAPGGVTPRVLVLGPNNFRQTLSASTTLSPLAAGNYYLLPQSVRRTGGTTTDTAFSADPQTVAVNGSASANVSYAQAPGSGKLWTGLSFINEGTPLLLGFDAGDLASSSTALSASARLGQDASVDSPQDIAFDAGGNLWVASFRQNRLVQYSVSQLGSRDPALRPLRVLSSPDLDGPWGLAFDGEGGLWVSGGGKVVYFSAHTLAAATNSLRADRTLRGFSSPAGLAFDSTGNLWVADSATSRSQVLGFAPSKIAGSGSPTPDFSLTGGSATSPIAPQGLAFDASGNLWVSTIGWLFRYPKARLGNTAAQPDIQLQTDTPSFLFGAMAFDNGGNLWVTDFNGSQNLILMYAPAAQRPGLGQQVRPTRSFSGPDLSRAPYGLAFNLAPSGLPLR
ncbi:MAG: hypothetical protein SFU83_11255 [Meiothermus sp.]|nr:hypothetical protein [Meiothermus sp.]